MTDARPIETQQDVDGPCDSATAIGDDVDAKWEHLFIRIPPLFVGAGFARLASFRSKPRITPHDNQRIIG